MKIALLILAALVAALQATAQTAPASTTFSQAVGLSDLTVYVASATGISAGTLLFSDREAMRVSSVAAKAINVQRGYAGTRPTAHNSGVTVYTGTPDQFLQADPAGACTAPSGNVYVTMTGGISKCIGGQWTAVNLNVPGSGYVSPFPTGYPLASAASVANQTRYFQFVISSPTVVASASIQITTAVAASKFRIGIYNAPCTGAATLLAQSAVGSAAAAAVVNVALAVTLSPGVYWLGLTSDSDGVVWYDNYGPTGLVLQGSTFLATGNVSTGTGAALALPTSCGALTTGAYYFPGIAFLP
jgi:hypothetical protein